MSNGQLTIADQLALQQLNHDFAYFVDHCQLEPLLALFTDDVWYRHGSRLSQGKAELRAVFDRRNATGDRIARHVISGLRLQKTGEGTATGQSVVVTWAANGAIPIQGANPHLIADFDDEYIQEDDGIWRIRKRDIRRIFEAHDNPGPVGV